MAQYPTYEDGYRKGVEDATETLYPGFPKERCFKSENSLVSVASVNERQAGRREKLLTKKVTKWVHIWPNKYGALSAGTLFDSKEAAQQQPYDPQNPPQGPYPIEIEVPL